VVLAQRESRLLGVDMAGAVRLVIDVDPAAIATVTPGP
jgi:hypothetical protein